MKRAKTLTAFSTAALLACSGHASTLFDADFDGATVSDVGGGVYLGEITKTNLDAGTAVGDWAVLQALPSTTNRAARSIQGEGAANVTNKALRFGIDIPGTTNASNPHLSANLTSVAGLSDAQPISVSFDHAHGTNDGGDRQFYLTGVDGSEIELFQLVFYINGGTGVHRMGYVVGNTTTLIGANGDFNFTGSSNNAGADYDPSIMKNVEVVIDSDSYDIKLNGATLASGVAFKDASATGLASLEFASSTRWTGAWYDNILVEQVPEPSSLALLGLGGLLVARRRRG